MSKLEFCTICNNILYYTTTQQSEDTGEYLLVQQCRNCGISKNVDTATCAIEITTQNVDKIELLKSQYLSNKYIIHDHTIPRVDVECPRSSCNGKHSVMVVYDEEKIGSLYMCTTCEHWHE